MPEIGEVLDMTVLILKTLHEEGPLSITELAQKLGTNRNKTTRYIQALEQRQLVQKQLDPGPPRKVILTVTSKTKCILECLI
ncbi:MAG: MarR family transcriptional regulator [Desulfurococcales archaeon]|nr:MarR family transcriptional regulator [Desulfurococcales archaeon]